MSCKGICYNLENAAKSRRNPKFKNLMKSKLKKCTECEIVIKTDDLRCPCCSYVLRVSVR